MKTFACVIAGLMWTITVSADDKVPPKPDEATIKAWKAKGGHFTWLHLIDDGGMRFENNAPLLGYKTYLPAFEIYSSDVPAFDVTKLPAPSVPFAIRIDGEKTTLPLALMKGLAGVENLKGLCISGCVMTEKEWQVLGDFKSLTLLDLSGGRYERNPLPESILNTIKGYKSLERLRFHGMKLTAAGVKDLAELKTLHSLSLTKTGLTDDLLKGLTALDAIEELNLGYTSITDAGVGTLKSFKKLKLLNLSGDKLTDASVKELGTLTNLKAICLFPDNFSNVEMPKASRDKLRKLLPDCKIID